jgi:predicted Fe-Mo cluster-binding NifX family protein
MIMKVALATDDDRGLEAVLSHHFGRCPYYVLVDIQDNKVREVKSVKNPAYESHGEAGEVPGFIKSLGAHVIISGGMGPKAIGFFREFGIEAITGVSGMVKSVIEAYIGGQIEGATPCSDSESLLDTDEGEHDEVARLQEEMVAMRRELARATERLKMLEDKEKKQ